MNGIFPFNIWSCYAITYFNNWYWNKIFPFNIWYCKHNISFQYLSSRVKRYSQGLQSPDLRSGLWVRSARHFKNGAENRGVAVHREPFASNASSRCVSSSDLRRCNRPDFTSIYAGCRLAIATQSHGPDTSPIETLSIVITYKKWWSSSYLKKDTQAVMIHKDQIVQAPFSSLLSATGQPR